MGISGTRTPWVKGFPDVIVHHEDIHARNSHPAYMKAKAGDADAAIQLVLDLMSNDALARIHSLIGKRQAIIVPVAAQEVSGFNAIPDAMAQLLSAQLSLPMAAYDIKQSTYVAHTKADGWHRLVTPAMFVGTIYPGENYFLIDDHVGFGGTLANLRGYIEANEGQVIGMTTLTETSGAAQIAIRPETQNMLESKHGKELDDFWKTVLGHGIDCLTNIEAGYLCRVESIVAIKTRMARAATEARGRGVQPVRLSP